MALSDNAFGFGAGYTPLSYTGMAGPTSYGTLFRNVNAKRQEAAKYQQLVNNFRNRLGQNFSTGALTGASPFTPAINPQTAPTGATPGVNKSSLFDLVSVNKDPSGRFDQVNKNLLDRAMSFKPDYGQTRSTLSDALAKLNSAGSDIDANRADTDTLISKFRSLTPTLDAQVATQTNALNRIYDPNGLKADLAKSTEAGRLAELSAADIAQRQALLQARLAGFGGGGSSYTNSQLADATGRIGTEVAMRDADRRRQDIRDLLTYQTSNIGRTQDLATQNLLRQNIPIDARSRVLDQEVNLALRRLGAAGQAATIDQLTDELSTVGRQMGLSTQALQNYLASNFLGVQKQGDDYPLYISGGGGRGGPTPQPYYSDDGYYDPMMGQNPNKPPPIPAWVQRLRAQQGYGRPGQRIDYPNVGYYEDYSNPGNFNITDPNFDYSQPGPLNYPGFNRGDNLTLQDYYQGNIGDQDVLDYYSGEYDWR